MANYTEQDGKKLLVCPVCGKPQEDTIEEHLIPNRQTVLQEHECYECYAKFTVHLGENKKYYIKEKING